MPPRLRAWLRNRATRVTNDEWELVELSYTRYGELPVISDGGRKMCRAAVKAFDQALKSARPGVVKKAIARVAISTRSRAEDGDDIRFRIEVYTDELARFPEDVVLEACQRWARSEKWFPAVSEITERCENLVRYRRVTRDTMEMMS